MVAGWRRAFGTSTKEPKVLTENQQQHWNSDYSTNQICEFPSSPSLHCRTSPNLQPNNASTSPKWFQSSPNSPSSYYSLLKSSLRLSKSFCGICNRSVKTGEGKAIFTAECSHIFHFPCIAAHVNNQQIITCPVCSTNWKNLQPEKTTPRDIKTTTSLKLHTYNDDEPLLSPISVSRFNTIPESNEEEEEDEENKEPIESQSQGFEVSSSLKTRTFDAFLLPETAIVASNRSFETILAVLKVKAKPYNVVAHRPPVDLVTVLDVGSSVSGEEILMMKRSMQVVISSLGSSDRLSVVVFSGGSKRLFPLRRMTGRGRRAARRVVEALAVAEITGDGAPARKEALKKAAKVLEDRRQSNPVAKIILLSNGKEDRRLSSSRFSHLNFPVHALSYSHAQQDGAFAERVGSLLRVVAQDIKLELRLTTAGEITAVYSPGYSFTTADSPCSAVIGDLHAAEEREFLVELKVPSSRGSQNNVISVRCSNRDPLSQEVVNSKERAMIVPPPCAVGLLDPKIKRLMRLHVSTRASVKKSSHEMGHECLEKKMEPLTPMSAWSVAERLAKVAMMRKSMNKVSDLHGFENAGF